MHYHWMRHLSIACVTLIGARLILANKITITTFSLVPVKYRINFTAILWGFLYGHQTGVVLAYVIAWVALVFGINYASNVGLQACTGTYQVSYNRFHHENVSVSAPLRP